MLIFNQLFEELAEEGIDIYNISDDDLNQDLYINLILTEEEYNIYFKEANESSKVDLFLY